MKPLFLAPIRPNGALPDLCVRLYLPHGALSPLGTVGLAALLLLAGTMLVLRKRGELG